MHTGLLLDTEIAWDDYRVTRFKPRFPHPHGAKDGWFSTTRHPPQEFSTEDQGLALLRLDPWCFDSTTAADCGRRLAAALTEEVHRLSPLLDRTTLLATLIETDAGIAPIILTMLPDGMTQHLEECLQRAESDADPDNHDLAEWARSQLAEIEPIKEP